MTTETIAGLERRKMVQLGQSRAAERDARGPEISSSPSGPRRLSPGMRLGPFTLLAPLGAGAAGYVWTAVQSGALGFTQRTALKLLRPERWQSPRAQRRFEREARIGAELAHPNVRSVYDVGELEGCPYMSLRWVDTSLAELLEHAPGHRLEPSVAAFIAVQCCAALEAAHGFTEPDGSPAPVLHRDLSPDNILLTPDGHVLLADFAGAASEAASADEAAHDPEKPPPSRDSFFGKLAYAAPEALRESRLDARADLFSLGCVLHQMLAGRPPFEHQPNADEHALILHVLENRPPDLRALAPSAPAQLIDIVHTCMQSDREARFPNAAALRRALCRTLQRSDFDLEESTSELMRATLGPLLEQREAQLFRHLEGLNTTAPGQRTETLPLAKNPTRPEEEESEGRATTTRSPEAPRGPARPRHITAPRILWATAAITALTAALYASTRYEAATPPAAPPLPITAAALHPKPEKPSSTAPPPQEQEQPPAPPPQQQQQQQQQQPEHEQPEHEQPAAPPPQPEHEQPAAPPPQPEHEQPAAPPPPQQQPAQSSPRRVSPPAAAAAFTSAPTPEAHKVRGIDGLNPY